MPEDRILKQSFFCFEYSRNPSEKQKKKKYKRRDAERLLYAFVSNIPSQEFLSNGLYLRVKLFSDSLQVSSALFPSCISRLQMVPGILFITLVGMY